MHYIVGLGNPGEEYDATRHNVGRMVLEAYQKSRKLDEFFLNKKLRALSSEGKIKKEKFLLILPETFMNKSGESLKPIITSKKKAESLIVVHDDLDLPLGRFKIAFNRGSGGHKGVESMIRAVKTEAFIRIKIGISKATSSGKLKKPSGKEVLDFIIGQFKKLEHETVKKVSKKVGEAIDMIMIDGKEKAMGEYNKS